MGENSNHPTNIRFIKSGTIEKFGNTNLTPTADYIEITVFK